MLHTYSSSRCIMVFFSFLALVIAYIIRTNLSIAIVAMVNFPKHNISNNCGILGEINESLIHNLTNYTRHPSRVVADSRIIPALPWDKRMQGHILASFFYGYILTQIPGGWLSFRYGAKGVLAGGLALASICTLISPPLARLNPYAFMFARFGQGLGEGVMLPATHSMISKWSPPMQRTRMTTIIYSGIPIGTIAAMPLSGYLAKHGFANGWPSIFYVTGLMGCLWFLFWVCLVHESPFANPNISASELARIKSQFFPHNADTNEKQNWNHIPLSDILKSLPFWAICFSNVSHTWGLYTLITEIPTYFREVLNMLNITSNGLYSALPFVAMLVCLLTGGQIADHMRSKHRVPTVFVRKLFNSIGLLVPAVLFVCLSYLVTDACKHVTLAICLITLIAGFLGFGNSGYMVNTLDLSPPLAGILLSITNTFGTLSGIVSPTVTSAFTSKDSSPEEWRRVFLFSAFILTVGAVFFIFAASGIEQRWSTTRKAYDIVEDGKKESRQE